MRTKTFLKRVTIKKEVEDVLFIVYYDEKGVKDVECYVDDEEISILDIDNNEQIVYDFTDIVMDMLEQNNEEEEEWEHN